MSIKTTSDHAPVSVSLSESKLQRASVGFKTQKIQSEQQYEALARAAREQGYTHIPVVRETLADLDTPVSTYLKLADSPYSYLFESVQGGDKWGRYSIIGLPCDTVYQFEGSSFTTKRDDVILSVEDVTDPLEKIRELQSQYKVLDYEGLPEMIGGLVGYFGYETIAYIEPRLGKIEKPDLLNTPDIMLLVSTEVLVFDNLAGRIFMVSLAKLDDPDGYIRACNRLKQIENSLRHGTTQPTDSSEEQEHKEDYTAHFSEEKFLASVEKCRDYIRDGDIMQVVLSQRLSTPYHGSSFDLYRALRTINPSPYMYFLNMGNFDIAGSSPEILVRLENDTVTVRPIAGTRKRGEDAEADLALEKELLADKKELAEHVMLIDLGRNDVGRIAEIGSVDLTERMTIERYSHVMHIVSNVEGKLAPELDAIDVIKATFPAGTVSGAPKIRAMEIIAELEPCKRGIYSGAIGYLGWNGNMDTAISIRTAVIKDGVLNIQAGAGIVADSVPEFEWKETLSKARAIFKAVELVNNNFGLGGSQATTADSEESR